MEIEKDFLRKCCSGRTGQLINVTLKRNLLRKFMPQECLRQDMDGKFSFIGNKSIRNRWRTMSLVRLDVL